VAAAGGGGPAAPAKAAGGGRGSAPARGPPHQGGDSRKDAPPPPRAPHGQQHASGQLVVLTARVTLAFWVPTDDVDAAARAARAPGVHVTALVRGALLPGGHPSSIAVRLCGQGIRLMTKMPPSGGVLAALPITGTAFVDVFRFSTSSWTAESSLFASFASTAAAAAFANSSDLVTALAPLAWPGVVASALARRLADWASPTALFDAATACAELSTPRASLDLTALPVPAPWWFTLASVLAAAGGGSGTRASVTVLCQQMLDGLGPTSASLLTTSSPSAALRFSFRVDTSGSPSPPLAIVDASSPIALVRALALVNADSGLASQTTWPGLALSNLTVESSWASLLSQNTSAPLSDASALAYVLAVDADGPAGDQGGGERLDHAGIGDAPAGRRLVERHAKVAQRSLQRRVVGEVIGTNNGAGLGGTPGLPSE
jgi:hypothetical protein